MAPVLALLLLQRLPAARPALSGGNHEGDWELVQLRLDAAEQPVAGRLLPAQAGREQGLDGRAQGAATRRSSTSPAARTPTTSRTGSHWTGNWFDQADGKGPQIAPDARGARRPQPAVGAVAGLLGRHEAGHAAAGLRRARSARAGARTGWTRPSSTAPRPKRGAPPAPAAPRPPSHAQPATTLVVRYDAPPEATALAVALRPKGSDEPADHPRVPARRRPRARSSSPPTTATTTSGRASSAPTAWPPKASRRSDGHREPVRVASTAAYVIVAITGEIDISNARELEAAILAELRRRRGRPGHRPRRPELPRRRGRAPALPPRASAGCRSRSSSPRTARRAACWTSAARARGPGCTRSRGRRGRAPSSNPVLRMPAAIPVIVASSGARASSRPARTRRSSSTCRCESGSIHGLRCSRRRCSAGVSSSSRSWPVIGQHALDDAARTRRRGRPRSARAMSSSTSDR